MITMTKVNGFEDIVMQSIRSIPDYPLSPSRHTQTQLSDHPTTLTASTSQNFSILSPSNTSSSTNPPSNQRHFYDSGRVAGKCSFKHPQQYPVSPFTQSTSMWSALPHTPLKYPSVVYDMLAEHCSPPWWKAGFRGKVHMWP